MLEQIILKIENVVVNVKYEKQQNKNKNKNEKK